MTRQTTLFGGSVESEADGFELGNDPDENIDREFETWGPTSTTPVTALSSEADSVTDVNGSVDERRAESFGLSVGGPEEDLVSDPDPPRRFGNDRGDSAPDAHDLPDEIGQDLASEQEPSGWRPRSARQDTTPTDIKRAKSHGRYLREVRDAPNSPGKRKASTGRYVGDDVDDAGIKRQVDDGLFR